MPLGVPESKQRMWVALGHGSCCFFLFFFVKQPPLPLDVNVQGYVWTLSLFSLTSTVTLNKMTNFLLVWAQEESCHCIFSFIHLKSLHSQNDELDCVTWILFCCFNLCWYDVQVESVSSGPLKFAVLDQKGTWFGWALLEDARGEEKLFSPIFCFLSYRSFRLSRSFRN